MAKKISAEIRLLVGLLDRAYKSKSWHGTNLKGSLRGLKPDQLIWRPGRNRHSIWELALHCAYWKYVVLRKITRLDRGGFPRSPSNWPSLPEKPDIKAWKNDLVVLNEYHSGLIEAVTSLSAPALWKKATDSKFTCGHLIEGAASHDLYHAGQIQLVKRLYKKS